MSSQSALWQRFLSIQQRVHAAIGPRLSTLSHEFRSEPAFMAYAGLCGEVRYAYEDGELTEELVQMVENYAEQVMDVWREGYS